MTMSARWTLWTSPGFSKSGVRSLLLFFSVSGSSGFAPQINECLALHCLLFCSRKYGSRSILIHLRFHRLHLDSFRPPFPARFLFGVCRSGFAFPIRTPLVLICLLLCSHDLALPSILISRHFCRLLSSLLTSVTFSSISQCLVLLALHHHCTHV